MMMLSVVHGFRSRINGNAEVSATGPTSRVNLASSASSGHLGATVPPALGHFWGWLRPCLQLQFLLCWVMAVRPCFGPIDGCRDSPFPTWRHAFQILLVAK